MDRAEGEKGEGGNEAGVESMTEVERVQRLATLDKPEEKELLEVSRLMESN